MKPRGRKSKNPNIAPAEPAPDTGPVAVPGQFLNRELSWLEFNRRVLNEARDDRTPLLERLRFLGIFSSNLDEFFMKRVGGLKRQVAVGILRKSIDGMSPAQQLEAIRSQVIPMLADLSDVYLKHIKPALAKQNIRLSQWEELSESERAVANEHFRSRVFPVLTPLAVDPSHPFPFISNLSTSLGVTLARPGDDEQLFARIKIPKTLPQWIRIETPEGNGRLLYVSLMDMVRDNLDSLFPNMKVLHVMPFRITRNADVERDEEDAEDLLEMIEQEIRRRRFEKIVRLEHGPNPDPWMLKYLLESLEITESDVYEMQGELDYRDLDPVADNRIPALRYEPWTPQAPPAMADPESDMFGLIRKNDLLFHHPFEDFSSSVVRFIRAATEDPKVLAIKMTLYRTADDSPMIHSLIRAAEAGKQVVCLVELKARFDEERNIFVAQLMEKAGIHVVYGLVGLKSHAKIALVIREESDALRCYAHIGTGNYNDQTARVYTDLSLFTARPEITAELVEFFNFLTGRSLKREYKKLLVAPINMKARFLEMIGREIANRKAGKPAHLIAKMNSLEDDGICRALCLASQAGVGVDLIVRGFCCLAPGIPGLSENIRVISVVGRFLEHSRIFYFRNGAADPVDGEFYIGSADWMYRNMLGRVEIVAAIEPRALREKCWEILSILWNDRRQAWDLKPDGTYVQRRPEGPESDPGAHQRLMALTRQRCAKA